MQAGIALSLNKSLLCGLGTANCTASRKQDTDSECLCADLGSAEISNSIAISEHFCHSLHSQWRGSSRQFQPALSSVTTETKEEFQTLYPIDKGLMSQAAIRYDGSLFELSSQKGQHSYNACLGADSQDFQISVCSQD